MVSISLLLYKPGFYLRPCLKSIFRQSFRDFELLVIDNHSADGTAQKAEEILKSEAGRINWRLIINDKNTGFAAGHNLGIREARGEFILLLNQDVVLDKDFLKNIIEVFQRDSKIGAIQGKLLRLKVAGQNLEESDLIDTTGLEIFKNRRIVARGQGQKDEGQFEKTEEIFGADGAAPVFRKAALEDVKLPVRLRPACGGTSADAQFSDSAGGGEKIGEYLDEDFFMYKEDVDLAWRLRLLGWKAVFEPKAVAWHARTAGESAAKNYWGILRERRKIGNLAKYFSFKNQRLMQIKNEQGGLLLKHLPWFLPKEIASWIYVLIFEHYIFRTIKDFFHQVPRAWQKKKIIMARQRVGAKEMEVWFK